MSIREDPDPDDDSLHEIIVDDAMIEQIIMLAFSRHSQQESIFDDEPPNFNTCPTCNRRIYIPFVRLYCDCEYHLDCFATLRADSGTERCVGCDDKIHKTEDEEYKICSICLEPLKEDLHKLTCQHYFHWNCIKQWHSSMQPNKHKCPVCRCHIRLVVA